jgi:DNA-binding MarR family transcriptional regulator
MSKRENPYHDLKQIFHEPNRLAIMSSLCNTEDGCTFNELKEDCNLTDGNLSRHLKALEEQKMIRIKKSFVHGKPQTRVFLTDRGRQKFIDYLQALEEVLKIAAESLAGQEKEAKLPVFLAKLAGT